MLVLSFSPIASDARVLKQVRHLSRDFHVVTCGYGPAPDGVAAHLRVPDVAQNQLDGRLITARAYRAAYGTQAGVRWVRRHLPAGTADVILADDLDAVPLALALRPRAGVHADLHEYFPRLHEEDEAWMRRISPYQEWLCRRFLPRCAAVTTVSRRIAQEYAEQFGVEVGVVTNAAPYADLSPGPVGSPLRLVHSGACLRNRDLHVMLEAVVAAAGEGADVRLDLYLTPNDPGYLQELRAAADASGGVVTVHDPVPYAELPATLNGYDVGVHVLPPVSFNNANALPNKVFDYVQARLGLLVGPSPEMARLVHDHGLGEVAAGFDARSVADAVRTLEPDAVGGFKAASHAAARELSDAEQSRRWVESVRGIAGRGRHA
ncbi:glycosyltransferase family 1 protein [Ornithinimicrobium avium]|uniref:Glycosyltransferase family 1 protein n=1 Tax=Ornithinimicrobium avium TaxID=2283195 RepID=A0A345NS85_9MICO|nr:glycosyltransferase family 1 protein [Ornithinimicrobium avium]